MTKVGAGSGRSIRKVVNSGVCEESRAEFISPRPALTSEPSSTTTPGQPYNVDSSSGHHQYAALLGNVGRGGLLRDTEGIGRLSSLQHFSLRGLNAQLTKQQRRAQQPHTFNSRLSILEISGRLPQAQQFAAVGTLRQILRMPVSFGSLSSLQQL